MAYLHPAMERPNLTVIPRAMATRILFEGNRAVGVEYARDGKVEEVRAEREVILSAGAYQSPVLLMVSGIGPAEDLKLLMIDAREDLPVGENLQDHLMANLNILTTGETLLSAMTPDNLALFEEQRRGPLTSNIPEAGAFFRTRPGLDAPDVQFHYAPVMFWDEGLTPPVDHAVTFGPVVIKPSSRGRVMLRAALADAKPRVLHNYLTTDEDRQSMIAGMRIALEIAEQPALKAVERGAWRVPESDSDEDIMEFVRAGRVHRLPPDLELRDRLGRGSGAARLRLRGPARRRRLGDAYDHAREHERADDDDRREGRRPDPRQDAIPRRDGPSRTARSGALTVPSHPK